MALSEVKKFIAYIKANRKSLEQYNEKLLENGSYMFMDPALMSESYPPLTTIPENPEDDILEEIINLKDKEDNDQEKETEKELGTKEKFTDRIADKWNNFVDDVVFEGKTKEMRIVEKIHRLFEKLSEIAKEENFEVSQDDLEYYIGRSVSQLINQHPKADQVQILEKLLDDFTEDKDQ
ncbi:MAG: hypothetical protein RR790_07535 [Eubacterium sp.]